MSNANGFYCRSECGRFTTERGGYYCDECAGITEDCDDYLDPYMGSDSDFSDHALGIDY